jgi:hypothetical protein
VSKKKKKTEYQWLMPIIQTTWEAEIRKIMVQGQPGQFARLHLQNGAKWTGGVAQVLRVCFVSIMPLSSNPSPTKKKKQKNPRNNNKKKCRL